MNTGPVASACPFCSGQPEFENTDECARLRCTGCGVEGGLFFFSQEECESGLSDETEARAIAAWNTRAAIPPVKAQGEAPIYLCNKCGYSGPVQTGHQRPNGSGECGYIARLIDAVQACAPDADMPPLLQAAYAHVWGIDPSYGARFNNFQMARAFEAGAEWRCTIGAEAQGEATGAVSAWAWRAFDPDTGWHGTWTPWRVTTHKPPRPADDWFQVVELPPVAGAAGTVGEAKP